MTRSWASSGKKGNGCERLLPFSAGSGSLDYQQGVQVITHNGETHSLTEWARLYGLDAEELQARLDSGLTLGEALYTPRAKRERLITYDGRVQNLRQWSDELDIPYYCLRSRLNKLHWTVERAFQTEYEGLHNGK